MRFTVAKITLIESLGEQKEETDDASSTNARNREDYLESGNDSSTLLHAVFEWVSSIPSYLWRLAQTSHAENDQKKPALSLMDMSSRLTEVDCDFGEGICRSSFISFRGRGKMLLMSYQSAAEHAQTFLNRIAIRKYLLTPTDDVVSNK